MTTAIIVAGGKSTRMGGSVDKAFLSISGKPVVVWSLMAFEKAPEIDRIVLVVRKEQQMAAKAVTKMFGISKLQAIVAGGTKRSDSVQAGLKMCDADTRMVVVHDAARPCVTPEVIAELMKYAKRFPVTTVAKPIIDTVKREGDKKGIVAETLDRAKLWTVQTPQAFTYSTLKQAFAKADAKMEYTDECQLVEKMGGVEVKLVENLKPNLKLTYAEDVQLLSALLK